MLAQLTLVLAMHGTATKLQNARNIKLEGAVSGNTNFDGSSNITIDTKLENTVEIVGTIELANGAGGTTISYPDGYTRENCHVLSYYCNITNGWNDYGLGQSTVVLGVSLREKEIKFTATSTMQSGPAGTKNFKIVLLKIK